MRDPIFDGAVIFGSLVPLLLLPYLLLLLAFPYAVLRLRDAHSRAPDPQLGFKCTLQFFFSISVLLILTGLTIIVVDAIFQIGQAPRPILKGFPNQPQREFPNPAQRVAGAFVVSGILFAGVSLLMILVMTSGPGPSPARRTFLGARCAVHGLVVMIAMTSLLVVFFLKTEPGSPQETAIWDARKTFIAILLVWAPSAVIHFSLFRLSSPPLPAQPRRQGPDWADDLDRDRNPDIPRP
jgi:hypothetical protein